MPVEASYLLATEPPAPPPGGGSAPSYGPEAYLRQLKQLLPQGAAWLLEQGSTLSRTLLAIADELARVDARAGDLLREQDPRTALETLEDWERVLGLPDDCLTELPEAIAERRVAVVQKLISRGGQSRAFYIGLAGALGYQGTTIEEYSALRTGFRAGALCLGDTWAHTWLVRLPVSAPGAGVVFRAGSRAGERLSGHGTLDVQCIIRRAAPAHTVVLFAFN